MFYLQDTPTGNCYYKDSSGVIQTISLIAAGTSFDVSLASSPDGWMDIELGFIRNTTYYGINRSFSTPFEFVRDSAFMIRSLFLQGVGTEVPLTLCIFKYNDQPQAGEPTYELYYKGNLDLPKISDTVLEGVKLNIMEGGVAQLLKAYENTPVQIPCDGSIPENIKVNLDGLLVQDSVFWQVAPQMAFFDIDNSYTLPLTKVSDEGDSFGAVISDTFFEPIGPNDFFQRSANSPLYFNLPTEVRIKGNFVVRIPVNASVPFDATNFLLWMGTSKSTPNTSPGSLVFNYAKSLIPQFNDTYPIPVNPTNPYPRVLIVQGQEYRFSFDTTVPLDAYEKLFIFISADVGSTVEILQASINMSFSTQFVPTRAWGMTAWDLFRLIVKEICLKASTDDQTFNYEAKSDLLQSFLNFFVTCGDALRASGDPSYQKFYHFDPTNSNIFYGPVIKTTLKDFFLSIHAILCAALGNEQKVDENEKLFIERMDYVYDNTDGNLFQLGEVSELKWKFVETISDLEIGYEPQTYDQKAGKYEYNTKLEMKAPIRTFQKKLSKISKYRTDSYGIERLRSNLGNATTSTTRNDSDSAVFLINTDRGTWIYDFFKASFTSLVTDPDNASNTNIKFTPNRYAQPFSLGLSDGEYFQPHLDNGIFVFSEPAYIATESCNITINGTINRINAPALAPQDSITINLWVNGAIIYSETVLVTGINTPVAINHNFSQLFATGYGVYITAETTAFCEAELTDATLTIGSYVTMSGTFIPVERGTNVKVLSLPVVSPSSKPYVPGTSHVQYGFQYFVFNTIAVNTNFSGRLEVTGFITGSGSAVIQVYKNGSIIDNLTVTASGARAAFQEFIILPPADYALGDIIHLAVVQPTAVTFFVFKTAYLEFDSTFIKAYALKRVLYDSLIGVPNIAKDGVGNYRTDIAGAPYNIEDFTPKRMYNRWKPFINGCFLDQVTGQMKFQTLSKNQFLSTTVGTETITEAASEDILGNDRLFYPMEVEFKTKVPETFAKLMTGTANAKIHITYFGYDIYIFADSLKQKPALNESQTWTGIVGPSTDISLFINPSADGLKLITMGDNSVYTPFISSTQFVPLGETLPAKYHTKSRNYFWFSEQVGSWVNQNPYWRPCQIGDIIPLQHITRGLDPVSYMVYKCSGEVYINSTNLDTVSSAAVSSPYVLWQKQIDTSTWPEGAYYIKVTAGVGDLASVIISEGYDVRVDWPETVYIEYSSSFNTQTGIFDAGYIGRIRIKGAFDNKFKQKHQSKTYIDQPQDVYQLNAIPYEETNLWLGSDDGVPDFDIRKVLRVLLLDRVTIEGEGFSLSPDGEAEEVFIEGNPKKFVKIPIRPQKNLFGIAVNSDGADLDSSIIATFDFNSIGPNANNASGTTDHDLIEVKLDN